jgi:O-glycosyl hydrolase
MKRFLIAVFMLLAVRGNSQSKITVDPSAEHQTIQGFGAFGGIKPYWETPPFYTSAFLDYFLDDLGATIVRTNIFWDLEPVNDNRSAYNLDLAKFNYKEGSNLGRQIPYYVALKEAGLKKLIATSWTPPEWMKLHDDPSRTPKECYNCNSCPVGDPARAVCGGRLDPKYYEEYAEYLVAYVRILKQEAGIDLYGISIQNEPYFANPFESNVVKPGEYGALLEVVGRRFRNEGLTTRLFGPEHMAEWSWGVQKDYVSNIFDNEGGHYLDIYALHGYVDGVAPDYGSADGWTSLKTNISDQYGKALWMTETSGYPQTEKGAMDLAKSMYLALRFGEISAWVYWSVSGDPGSEFSIMANGEPTLLYYVSKQFFKYLRPGAIRVDATAEDAGILPLAFKNPTDGSMSIVLINTSASEKDVALEIPVRPAQFTAYRTSATENCIEAGTVGDAVSLPPSSITTLVGYGPSAPSIDEIPDYYIHVGDNADVEIPLSGISNGNGGKLHVEMTSSDPSLTPAPVLHYTSPSTTGTLTLHPSASTAGTTVITLRLSNDNQIDASAFGFNSTEVSFSVVVLDAVTGVNKKKVETETEVYPNPVNSRILLVHLSPFPGNHRLEVFNARGERMFCDDDVNAGAKALRIDTSPWPGGVYYIKTSHGAEITSRKIVIP